MNGAQSFLEEGIDLQATLIQMLSGDGSQDAHYTYIATKFGFPDDATAHAAVNEFNSVMGKIISDASVSSVNAAIKQAMAKFR